MQPTKKSPTETLDILQVNSVISLNIKSPRVYRFMWRFLSLILLLRGTLGRCMCTKVSVVSRITIFTMVHGRVIPLSVFPLLLEKSKRLARTGVKTYFSLPNDRVKPSWSVVALCVFNLAIHGPVVALRKASLYLTMNNENRNTPNEVTHRLGTNNNEFTLQSNNLSIIFPWHLRWPTNNLVGTVTTKQFTHTAVRTTVERAWATASSLRKRPPSMLRTVRVNFYRKKSEATSIKGNRHRCLIRVTFPPPTSVFFPHTW